MKKLCFIFALSITAAASGAEVKPVNFDNPDLSIPTLIESLKTSNEELPPIKEGPARYSTTWTVMVYINAKNNLEAQGIKDINEMEQIGSSENLKITAELGRISGYSDEDGNWTGSRRYLLEQDNNPRHIASAPLVSFARSDMGSWKHLSDFIRWSKQNYPAKNYMLIIWNHGSGWDRPSAHNGASAEGISYDDETGTFITTSQLALALREAGGVDIYASDASLMQMMEVAYEIRDTIGYIAGSEETEPLDAFGYPYFFKQISSDTYPTPLQAGIYATEAYALNCQAMSVPYTYSLIDAKMLADFSKLIDEWTAAAMASGEAAAIKKVRDNGQKFGNPDNKDLYAFIAAVNGVTASSNLRNKGRTLLRFMSEKLVKANRVSDKYRQARGVSIYLPDWKYDPAYDTLQFSKDGSWDEFIKWLAR